MGETVLGNRYEIIKKIGDGGMAFVYKAKDILLNRIVAVKVLRPEFVDDDEFLGKFKREAEAVASLSHPNIVNVYDVGEDGKVHYIVMEYIDGQNLKEIIKILIPLLNKYNLQGIKRLNCDDFITIVKLVEKKEHLSEAGLEKIRQIKSGMNTGRRNINLNLFENSNTSTDLRPLSLNKRSKSVPRTKKGIS